jgi:hypothetical protein
VNGPENIGKVHLAAWELVVLFHYAFFLCEFPDSTALWISVIIITLHGNCRRIVGCAIDMMLSNYLQLLLVFKSLNIRSLNCKDPVHILLVGPHGQAKTLFLKCILETFGEKKAFFTVGGNASKSGMIDLLFGMRPKYLLLDELEHLKPEYQTALLSLMETFKSNDALESQQLKTWVFATGNGTKKLSEPLLSRFRVMYLNEYEFSQFYEISDNN